MSLQVYDVCVCDCVEVREDREQGVMVCFDLGAPTKVVESLSQGN